MRFFGFAGVCTIQQSSWANSSSSRGRNLAERNLSDLSPVGEDQSGYFIFHVCRPDISYDFVSQESPQCWTVSPRRNFCSGGTFLLVKFGVNRMR